MYLCALIQRVWTYMKRLQFLLEGVRDLKTIGTVTRSSKYVGKTMVKHVDFAKVDCVVELGAGDGPITQQIVYKLKPDAKLLCFEINEKFCEILKRQYANDPRVVIIQDSAENMKQYINQYGFESADAIISALPFVSLPKDLGDRILEQSKQNLKNQGKFIQLNYSHIPRKRYERIFGQESIVDFVMLNFPPAFIFVCNVIH